MTSRIVRLVFGAAPHYGGELAESCVPALPTPSPAKIFLEHLPLRLLSDEQVAAQLQAGHADALTVLFERHSARLFGIARRILRNDAEAEETVQTIFLDVYRAIQQFDPAKGKFKTWLLQFGYQRAFNRKRHLLSSRFFVTDSLQALPEFPGETNHSPYSPEERRILIQQVLGSLEPRQRRTIELVYGHGLTAEEAAIQTGETVRVVRHNLYRGLDRLRRRLLQDGEQSVQTNSSRRKERRDDTPTL
jgi:RNA polymerase sigma-70 factor, ECF subfamily